MSRYIKDTPSIFRALCRCLILPLSCFFAISIFTPRVAVAQSESVYSDQWVDSAGTLYLYGVTDASDMYEHSAYASVSISSPSGRHASNSFSAGEYGYADTETYLNFDQNDVGDYILEFYFSAYCPYYGDLGTGSTSAEILGFGIHEFAYVLQSMSNNYTYGTYLRCNPGTLCVNPLVTDTFFGGTLPQHCTIKWITYTDPLGGYVCVGVSGAIQTQCVPDPLP